MSTAADQLKRILHLIPLCADDQAHPLDQMATALDTDPNTLLRDLMSLSERFDDPGGFVEGVQVFVEPGRFTLRSDHFRRPMRLTGPELGALNLGLAVLESERPPDEQEVIRRARERLGQVLARLPDEEPVDMLHHAEQVAASDPAILRELREGVRSCRQVRIHYARATAAEATARDVAPLSVVATRGKWYLIGLAEGQVRVYRVDRVESATLLEAGFDPPTDNGWEAVLADGPVFLGQPAEQVVIRYSAAIAPWIAEREGRACDADGSLTLEHPLGDPEWAVGHVLQYGPEAEVLSPPAVRELVGARLKEMLE